VTRIPELVAGVRQALTGERLRLDKTMRLDVALVFALLLLAVTAFFLVAAMLGGPPDAG
jgi:hypothetical protein